MSQKLVRAGLIVMLAVLFTSALGACAPSPEMNVLAYLISDRLGTLRPVDPDGPTGSLTGLVLDGEEPISGATVVVAERTGRPHVAQTDENGRYQIDGIPVGQFVPAAIAPGYDEAAAADRWGVPQLADVTEKDVSEAPPLILSPHKRASSTISDVKSTNSYTTTAAFPDGAVALASAYAFERDGVLIDTLRLYRPLEWSPDDPIPLLLFVYPSAVDNWESVSTAYAAEGYGVVAISPVTDWGIDIDQHAQDAYLALQLARNGKLGQTFTDDAAVALGGSFSSAILGRLLRDTGEELGAWVTVGGIGNAFDGAHDFYTGEIQLPEQYQLVVPAMGNPQLYPLTLLRFSPVFAAAQMPPTLIIHTASDSIIPISQAEELAEAAKAGDVPVETYFYDDVSHYLEIDENMTDEGKAMYYHILDFIQQQR